jgi:hypothetical protein
MSKYRTERPHQGWPAFWRNWVVGDSYPVVGHFAYVADCIYGYGMNQEDFKVQPITPTLTRVTRIG